VQNNSEALLIPQRCQKAPRMPTYPLEVNTHVTVLAQ